MNRRALSFAFALTLSAVSATGAEIDRIASFSAGEPAPCNDSFPDIAVQPGGSFLLVWQQSGCPSPPAAFVHALRFDAAGRPLGSLNYLWPGLEPQVAPLPDGGFVVASRDLQVILPPRVLGINLHRLDALGRAVGEPVSVVTDLAAPNLALRLAVAPNGTVAVVWEVVTVNPLFPSIVRGRFFNSALVPLSEAFNLSDGPVFPGQFEPAIAFQADGTALALWSGNFRSDGLQVYGRRFDGSGHPLTSDFPVSQGPPERANFVPRAVAGLGGGWWVGWFSDPQPFPPPPGPDPGQTEARGVRLGTGGERLGGEQSLGSLQLSYTPPALGTDGRGNLLLLGTALDGSIAGRRIDSDGTSASDVFNLSGNVSPPYRYPAVAPRSPAAFVAAWSGDSIFAPAASDLFGAILAPVCLEGKSAACLGPDARYGVEVAWQIGAQRGTAKPLPLAGNVATFGLRNAADHDVTVLLSGPGSRDLTVAATTGAALEFRVTDKTTGAVRTFNKPAGRFASGRFSGALPNLSSDAARSTARFVVPEEEALAPEPAIGETCAPTSRALCLLGGRFRAELLAGQTPNPALAITRTDKSGAFALPRASEAPLVTLTMIDGRASNGKFWVYLGGLSPSGYRVKITDLSTGASKTYANPVGKLDSRADRQAF